MIFMNDKIVAYLSQNGIPFSGTDFVVMFDDQGVESITAWDTVKLGAQPDQATLDTAYTTAQTAKVKTEVKAKAAKLLTDTDWVEIPSVSNTANIPHLANYAEFITYRLALRLIAVNPIEQPIWPIAPAEQWITD
jgi:hypothetical protein